MTVEPIRLGTRGSRLALLQAEQVRDRLIAAHPALAAEGAVRIVEIRTTGDKVQDRALAEIGDKGLFVKELEEALLDRRVDAAVHSMKDVPTRLPAGFEIAALLEGADPRDAFVSPRAARLEDLPEGAVIASASVRRLAQALERRPDLRTTLIRGNVQTRLRKLEEGLADATFLAKAGLDRLGTPEVATRVLEPEEMMPAVAQGVIGVEIREEDARMRDLLAPLDHGPTASRVEAERALLAALDGSCRTPIGALAEFETGGALRLRALIAMPDGSTIWRTERRGLALDAAAMGRDAGEELRALADPACFADES
ncbi:MAG: hydroxymethylbilane synthase [Proteobacteria bacterium]|nr:hydroxymethylbilane synthase [Pseudomonadota bacterium]